VLRRSKKLLQEAGWEVKGGKLVDKDGNPFTLEFMYASSQQERVVAPFMKNLERLGVETKLRLLDPAQYVRRRDDHDFDMIIGGPSNSSSPGNEQRNMWGSEAADSQGSGNQAGVKNPVIDALWGHYGILELYTPTERVAWWHKKIVKPEETPSHSIGFPTVWWSAEVET